MGLFKRKSEAELRAELGRERLVAQEREANNQRLERRRKLVQETKMLRSQRTSRRALRTTGKVLGKGATSIGKGLFAVAERVTRPTPKRRSRR